MKILAEGVLKGTEEVTLYQVPTGERAENVSFLLVNEGANGIFNMSLRLSSGNRRIAPADFDFRSGYEVESETPLALNEGHTIVARVTGDALISFIIVGEVSTV